MYFESNPDQYLAKRDLSPAMLSWEEGATGAGRDVGDEAEAIAKTTISTCFFKYAVMIRIPDTETIEYQAFLCLVFK